MDATEMVNHSQFHQRPQHVVPRCPICSCEMFWERLEWMCNNHPTVWSPSWEVDDGLTCPYPSLHV